MAFLPNVTPLLEIVGKYEKKPFKMRLLRCISFFLVANLVAKDI